MLDLAKHIWKPRRPKFDTSKLDDRYEMREGVDRGQKVGQKPPARPRAAEQCINLMDALRRSVKSRPWQGGRRARSHKRAAPKRASKRKALKRAS